MVALDHKWWILNVETIFEVIDVYPLQAASDVTRVPPFTDQAG